MSTGEATRQSARKASGRRALLGGVLYATTGEAADDYARHALFAPIGITQFDWFKGQPNGLPHMGGGLSLTSPDMACIGYLLLRKGGWGGRQVVSEKWVATMREHTTRQLGAWLDYSLDYGRTLWLLPPITSAADPDVIARAAPEGSGSRRPRQGSRGRLHRRLRVDGGLHSSDPAHLRRDRTGDH